MPSRSAFWKKICLRSPSWPWRSLRTSWKKLQQEFLCHLAGRRIQACVVILGPWQDCIVAIDLDPVDMDPDPDLRHASLQWTCLETWIPVWAYLLSLGLPCFPLVLLDRPLSLRPLPLQAWAVGHPPLGSSTCPWCFPTDVLNQKYRPILKSRNKCLKKKKEKEKG